MCVNLQREQVFSAALDLHYFSVAKAQLEALVIRFPASTRVKVCGDMIQKYINQTYIDAI
jgi:hypothetical protein